MKHTIASVLVFTSLFSLFSPVFAAADGVGSQKFVVTAYYSPLPNQSFYLRGSYEADVRLNGRGMYGASGKEVYPGMLAGPKTYKFGTKIFFPDLGVGTVDDRGGAIVSSGSRGYSADRIDIWMGSGEDGLRRALTWGKRTIEGQILSGDSIPGGLSPIALENFAMGKINIAKTQDIKPVPVTETPKELSPVVEEPSIAEIDIFSVAVHKKTAPETVKNLQKVLKDMSYYTGDVDGKYSPTVEKAIFDFQIENQIVSSEKNIGAGFYGTKTRTKLKEIYTRFKEYEKKQKNTLALNTK